jgi:hypothetical protein
MKKWLTSASEGSILYLSETVITDSFFVPESGLSERAKASSGAVSGKVERTIDPDIATEPLNATQTQKRRGEYGSKCGDGRSTLHQSERNSRSDLIRDPPTQ